MWTCPVCDTESRTLICPNCDFDSSRNYEQHPTLQRPAILPDAISLLREQRNAPAAPSVSGTLAAIRSQGWEPHVLSAVEKILNAAAEGNLTEQHRVEIFLDVTDADYSPPKKETILYSPEPIQLSSFCKVCGVVNSRGTIYCSGCGSKIDEPAPKAIISRSEVHRPQSSSPLPLSKFCDHCGCNIPSGSIYCPGCSAKVNDASPAADVGRQPQKLSTKRCDRCGMIIPTGFTHCVVCRTKSK